MKISGSQISTSVAAVYSLAFCLHLASAHPYHQSYNKDSRACSQSPADVASQIACGDAVRVESCINAHWTGADEAEHKLAGCLVHAAGCTREEAHVAAARASRRCEQGASQDDDDEGDEKPGSSWSDDDVEQEEVVIELREVHVEHLHKRDDDTSTSSTEEAATTSTSDATSTTATSSSSEPTTTASSTTESTTSSSATSTASSSSSTASATSSGTASSTSSSSTSTSTGASSSASSADAFGAWSYVIATVMGVYVAVCMGCICWRCCAERNQRKKAAKLADEKEALALMKS